MKVCRSFGLQLAVLLIAALAWLLTEAAQAAGVWPATPNGCRVRPQDELWLISTRHLGCPESPPAEPALEMLRYGGGGWHNATLAQFLHPAATGTGAITTFFVHGNREDWSSAMAVGWSAYWSLVRSAVDDRPVRFVIWSWPSDRIFGPLRDVRVKAERTETDAYYLGWLLSQMPPAAPVSLVGYSYGARIVLGALHLSAGGKLWGRRLNLSASKPISRVRTVLLAAAEHNHWLIPGAHHDHAYLRIHRMLVLYNSCDPVLARYRWVDPCSQPIAMGYSGAGGLQQLPDEGRRIKQRDVCCLIGKTHEIPDYFAAAGLVQQMQQYLFWQPVGP